MVLLQEVMEYFLDAFPHWTFLSFTDNNTKNENANIQNVGKENYRTRKKVWWRGDTQVETSLKKSQQFFHSLSSLGNKEYSALNFTYSFVVCECSCYIQDALYHHQDRHQHHRKHFTVIIASGSEARTMKCSCSIADAHLSKTMCCCTIYSVSPISLVFLLHTHIYAPFHYAITVQSSFSSW